MFCARVRPCSRAYRWKPPSVRKMLPSGVFLTGVPGGCPRLASFCLVSGGRGAVPARRPGGGGRLRCCLLAGLPGGAGGLGSALLGIRRLVLGSLVLLRGATWGSRSVRKAFYVGVFLIWAPPGGCFPRSLVPRPWGARAGSRLRPGVHRASVVKC